MTDTKQPLPPDPVDNSDAQSILPPYEPTQTAAGSSSSEPAPPAYQPSMLEVGLDAASGKIASTHADDASFDIHAFNAEVLPPVALLLDGQTIVDKTSPDIPLYRVNRGLASLGPATKSVELDRYEQRSASVVRPRNMYQLRHSTAFDYVLGLGNSVTTLGRPEYYMRAASNRAAPLGHIGIKSRIFSQWTALPLQMELDTRQGIKAIGFDKSNTTPFFKAKTHPSRKGVIVWYDGDGKAAKEVALMYETMEVPSAVAAVAAEEGGKGKEAAPKTHTPRLTITAPMRRDRRDALVAVWCCYAWAQGVSRHVEVPLPRGKNPLHVSRVFN